MYNSGVIVLKTNWLSNSELSLLSSQTNLFEFPNLKNFRITKSI